MRYTTGRGTGRDIAEDSSIEEDSSICGSEGVKKNWKLRKSKKDYKEYCKKISLRNSKYNWYTNGKDNLRLKFGKKPPKGYKKGRIL